MSQFIYNRHKNSFDKPAEFGMLLLVVFPALRAQRCHYNIISNIIKPYDFNVSVEIHLHPSGTTNLFYSHKYIK